MVPKPPLQDKIKLQGVCKESDVDAWLAKGVVISFRGVKHTWDVYVAPIAEPLIIGIDFLCHFGAKIDFVNCTFALQTAVTDIQHFRNSDGCDFEVFPISLSKQKSIPGNSVVNVQVRSKLLKGKTYAIYLIDNNKGVFLPNVTVVGGDYIPLQLVNDNSRNVRLKRW